MDIWSRRTAVRGKKGGTGWKKVGRLAEAHRTAVCDGRREEGLGRRWAKEEKMGTSVTVSTVKIK